LDVVGKVFILSLKGVVPNRTPLDNGIMGKFDGSVELPSKQVISTFWDLVQLQEAEGKGMTSTVKFNDGKGVINYAQNKDGLTFNFLQTTS
jgi:hypothetical protein